MTSWCQRCRGRLVPRSAETPLAKRSIEKVVDKLRNVTALPKYAPISLKFLLPVPWCVLSSAAYSLNWTIPLMVTNRPDIQESMRQFTAALFSQSSQHAPARCHGKKTHSGERFVKCLTRSLFFDSSVLRSSYDGTNELYNKKNGFYGCLSKNNIGLGFDFKKEQTEILRKLNKERARVPTTMECERGTKTLIIYWAQ